jgi:hypothetical protein
VAILPGRGKVSPSVLLRKGGSSPSAGQAAARLLPPVGPMLVRCGLVLKTCPRRKRSPSKGRYPRPRGMRRSNARTHPPSPHLASLRALAPEPMPTPLLTGFGSSRSVRVVRFFPVLTCHSTHNNNIFPRCATTACQSTHSNNIFLRIATIACQSTYNNNKFLRSATTI